MTQVLEPKASTASETHDGIVQFQRHKTSTRQQARFTGKRCASVAWIASLTKSSSGITSRLLGASTRIIPTTAAKESAFLKMLGEGYGLHTPRLVFRFDTCVTHSVPNTSETKPADSLGCTLHVNN